MSDIPKRLLAADAYQHGKAYLSGGWLAFGAERPDLKQKNGARRDGPSLVYLSPPRYSGPLPKEGALAVMRRWSEFRQSKR